MHVIMRRPAVPEKRAGNEEGEEKTIAEAELGLIHSVVLFCKRNNRRI